MRTFSWRQTAALVAGACVVMLLLPVSVEAAGTTLTRITDGAGPVARVDPRGRLAVGDGSGPLTVDGSVGVTGTVNARPTRPTRPWMNVNGMTLNASSPTQILYPGQVGTRLNLTTFSASAAPGNPGSVTLSAQVLVGDEGDSCFNLNAGSFAAAERFTIVVPVGSTVVETFPSPLSWTQYGQGNDTYCVQLSAGGPSGWSVNVLANGFLG